MKNEWTYDDLFAALGLNKQSSIKAENIIVQDSKTTIVIWSDGTKTTSTLSGTDAFDPYVGFSLALAKKVYGGSGKMHKFVDDNAKFQYSRPKVKKN